MMWYFPFFPRRLLMPSHVLGTGAPFIFIACTIRMSHAMNMNGAPVPKTWEGINNRRGKNGKYHIIRVKNFRSWMISQFGNPDVEITKETGKAFDRSLINGLK